MAGVSDGVSEGMDIYIPSVEDRYKSEHDAFVRTFGGEPTPEFAATLRRLVEIDHQKRIELAAQIKEETELQHLRIVNMCEELHMANTGAADPLPRERRAEIRDRLQKRLDQWSATPIAEWAAYDEAIKSLIVATLAEPALYPWETS